MRGKYTTRISYWLAKLKRIPIRMAIRSLVRWRPLTDPKEGYTVLIGVNHGLVPMLGANLAMLARQDKTNLDKVIVVINRTRETMDGDAVEAKFRAAFPELPLEFVFFSNWQERVSSKIGWAWVYSWLCWSIGIGVTETRYAILHDFDALLIDERVFEERYELIRGRGDQYVGVRYYRGNGVEEDDQLVTTFEMIFDVGFVRDRFRSLDLFNHVCVHRGRSVDFDTFLLAQSRDGNGSVDAIDALDMVHPSQMICQFVELTERSLTLAPASSNLLMVPYYLYVAGETGVLDDITVNLESEASGGLPFFGREIEKHRLNPKHAEWMRIQAGRVETAIVGEMRDPIRRYFDNVDRYMVKRDEASDPDSASTVASS